MENVFRTEDYFVGAMLHTSYKPDFLTGFLISKQTYETEVEGIKFRYGLAIEILRSEPIPNMPPVVTCGVKIFPDKSILTEEVTNHLKKEYGFEHITDYEIISDGLSVTLAETMHNINDMSDEEFQQLLKAKAEVAITQILPNIVEKLTNTHVCDSADITCWEYLKNYIVK